MVVIPYRRLMISRFLESMEMVRQYILIKQIAGDIIIKFQTKIKKTLLKFMHGRRVDYILVRVALQIVIMIIML